MKTFIPLFFLIVLSCQSKIGLPEDEIPVNYEVCATDLSKNLSYTPTGKVVVQAGGKNIEIDFSCDAYMAEHIFEYADRLHDTVHTLGELANAYKTHRVYFKEGWSSISVSPYIDSDYVLPKLEYMFAQECLKNDCCHNTRKAILRMVMDKHNIKYYSYTFLSHTTRQTGIFLMASILIKENDKAFINALIKDIDLQNTLRLNVNVRVDEAFGNIMMQYAENFLKQR